MPSGVLNRVKSRMAADIESGGGRHDEPEIYEGPAGDPGLCGGPESISWEIHGDLASLVLAGPGAIIMEVLHPSVIAGVCEQSSYRTEPLRRAQNTLGYVLRTTFGSTEAATAVIERVKKIHGYINGVRPDGVEYRALDPELIAWVHTCIPWAVMCAYDRYARPLSREEKDRYLSEQSVVGIMGGADWVPTSTAELDEFVRRMAPKMGLNEQTISFLDFLAGRTGDENEVGRRQRFERRMGLRGSMALMPAWARRLVGLHHSDRVQRMYVDPAFRLQAGLIRWVYPELPCKRMALARASGVPATSLA